MNRTKPMRIELMSRPGCHLCEDAHRVLLGLRQEFALDIVEVDISQDQELLVLYRNDIPVALCEGEELFRHRADPAELKKLLRAKLRRS